MHAEACMTFLHILTSTSFQHATSMPLGPTVDTYAPAPAVTHHDSFHPPFETSSPPRPSRQGLLLFCLAFANHLAFHCRREGQGPWGACGRAAGQVGGHRAGVMQGRQAHALVTAQDTRGEASHLQAFNDMFRLRSLGVAFGAAAGASEQDYISQFRCFAACHQLVRQIFLE